MNQERNMMFMQIAMKYLPNAKEMMDEKGIEMNMDDLQPMLEMLLQVMDEAYELGCRDAEEAE
ncbi:ComZ family protein [Bacillus marinisedimentorum]|uniref:ComZ family protein n=1 Tax=Bacillus marinisedimentorum TaxID=1821260 RepID=UPI000871ED3F|nr:ComZ family protein [Bacillus marinisedimentorum]